MRAWLMGLVMACALMGPLECRANEACFADAAATHAVPAEVLQAIATVESQNDPTAVRRNRNGSVDLGLMQINSSWLPRLKRQFGITREKLMDACINVKVGAWILASNLMQYRHLKVAVGAYHSPTPWRREAYSRKVFATVASLQLATE